MKKIIISIAMISLIISCQSDGIDCGIELLRIEKKYNKLFEDVNYNQEKVKDLYRQKAVELENINC